MRFQDLPAYQIRSVAESILDMAEALFERHLNIRALDWRVLVKLSETPGSMSTAIARDMLLTPVQTGRSLQRLRELDLVIGAPDPDDGRAMRYTLTPNGEKVHDTGMRIVVAVQEFALREFSAVEQVALTGLLERLMETTNFTANDVDRLSERLFETRA
ncbi:MarR family winged helix-turn-helix transcriptional regulator [Chitinasiproducens palmae]|uniref:DNA-binding transcriptional regulator, MarR family n=1 Tax=Chitinasiproducens palmae TaxID=1770053 RepID=A0A1H2PKG1_9BURK|nr:MarR family winged helix-turn-helix transcriptional regulator [Chitinasiproducens palmae]SDV46917.1 DNA-binding transcriptional regulator, MarR family [Chitinasiproducens palmae]